MFDIKERFGSDTSDQFKKFSKTYKFAFGYYYCDVNTLWGKKERLKMFNESLSLKHKL